MTLPSQVPTSEAAWVGLSARAQKAAERSSLFFWTKESFLPFHVTSTVSALDSSIGCRTRSRKTFQ